MSKSEARQTLIQLLASPFRRHREASLHQTPSYTQQKKSSWTSLILAIFMHLLLLSGGLSLAWFAKDHLPVSQWTPYQVVGLQVCKKQFSQIHDKNLFAFKSDRNLWLFHSHVEHAQCGGGASNRSASPTALGSIKQVNDQSFGN